MGWPRAFPWLTAAFLAGSVALAQPPNAEFDAGAYRALLQELAVAADRPISPRTAAGFRDRLTSARSVRLPDGSSFQPDNAALTVELNRIANAKRPTALRPELRGQVTLLSEMTRPSRPAGSRDLPDPAEVAKRILRGQEFQGATAPEKPKGWWEEWLEKIRKAIMDFFRSLTPRTPGGRSGPWVEWFARLVQWLLILVAMAGVLAGLIFVVRWAGDYRGRWRRRTGIISIPDLLASDSEDPLADSERLAAQGDYRGALRMAYIACLRRLAKSGALVLEENRTNWEYQRALRGRFARAYDVLLPATRLFDFVWYGLRPATAEEYATVVAVHSALENAVKPVGAPE
ncbi:MAG: DUF4129 domain-containing protein [Capsulimonadales bacterium]|nr:DUF4129 domain-containing protein [Capsulimonadales bacterium]